MAVAWIAAGVVDRMALFVAPRLLGSAGLAWTPRLGASGWSGRIVALADLGRDAFVTVESGA